MSLEHAREHQQFEKPLREDKYRSTTHPDCAIVTRHYADGSTTIDVEGDRYDHVNAVEIELKVILMRKGMIGLLRNRKEIEH